MEEKTHTTVRMDKETLKKFKMFCLENDTSLQGFTLNAMEYCLAKKILPKE